MTALLTRALRGEGLLARAARSSAITVAGFGATQAIRLASNLILTRLLFPEAFGMMALITVFIMGLAMFSDLGIGPSIMASRRGDEPAFLNTAWTIQIVRGLVLWVIACALAWPLAAFYGEPGLRAYLPVAALVLVISGFNPTRLETANRHLQAGRVTLIEIASQLVGIAVAVTVAVLTHSVWALVASNLAGALAYLLLLDRFLPGPRNRLAWEREAAGELIGFGKWIFLSTFMGFVIGQADKVILGRHLSLGAFGLYNIAFFLASFPFMLGGVVMRRVLIPVYRASPPLDHRGNFLRVRRMRAAGLAGLLALLAFLAFAGPWIVSLLYDPRYHAAGGIVVLVAAAQVPALLILTCDQAALAAGDSRRFFWFTLVRAALVTGGILAGLASGSLPGAILGQGIGNLLAYPALVWLLRPHGAWDGPLDALGLACGAVLAAGAIWFNAGALSDLLRAAAG